jgi:hypothetical protein
VPSPGSKNKQALLREMSKTLESVSSNLLERFIDTAYRFTEQPALNQGNFRPVNEIGEVVLLNDLSGEVPEDFPEGVYIRNCELHHLNHVPYSTDHSSHLNVSMSSDSQHLTSTMKLSSKRLKLLD